MKIQSKVAALVAILVGLVGGIVIASPAMAARSDCEPYIGTICLTENQDWSGRVWRQLPSQIGTPTNPCRNFEAAFNNKASIAANVTEGHVGYYLYDGANCTGRQVYIASAGFVKLWLLSPSFDNKASSIKVLYL
jgi:hypothetical protein